MSNVAADIFSHLKGAWDLQREIPGQGRIEGTVKFTPLSATRVLYDEKGLFYMESGAVLEPIRSYVYELRGEKIIILYDDPERQNEVLHELDFDPSRKASHTHRCGSDLYALDFCMKSPREIEMEYRVSGEKKDYTLRSKLTLKSVSD